MAQLFYVRLKVILACKPYMIRGSTSSADSQKAVEVRDYKPWVANSSIVLRTIGMLTADITYCMLFLEYVSESQVNTCIKSLPLSLLPREKSQLPARWCTKTGECCESLETPLFPLVPITTGPDKLGLLKRGNNTP